MLSNVSQCYQMLYNVIKVLYKCCTACIYCVRIDSSGISANAHRHLWACEADHKTNNNKIMHKNTSKSKQLQRHNRESSSSALPRAIINGVAAKPINDQQRQCMCACSNQLERHCRWPFMTTMARPQRFTIHLPNQGVAKLTPVPPS